ncbi:MAG TPA: hypothetical protein DEG71_02360 [Clostridiales bacterium]|nr:hypothetical protein [Clostridiales bacterium]
MSEFTAIPIGVSSPSEFKVCLRKYSKRIIKSILQKDLTLLCTLDEEGRNLLEGMDIDFSPEDFKEAILSDKEIYFHMQFYDIFFPYLELEHFCLEHMQELLKTSKENFRLLYQDGGDRYSVEEVVEGLEISIKEGIDTTWIYHCLKERGVLKDYNVISLLDNYKHNKTILACILCNTEGYINQEKIEEIMNDNKIDPERAEIKDVDYEQALLYTMARLVADRNLAIKMLEDDDTNFESGISELLLKSIQKKDGREDGKLEVRSICKLEALSDEIGEIHGRVRQKLVQESRNRERIGWVQEEIAIRMVEVIGEKSIYKLLENVVFIDNMTGTMLSNVRRLHGEEQALEYKNNMYSKMKLEDEQQRISKKEEEPVVVESYRLPRVESLDDIPF